MSDVLPTTDHYVLLKKNGKWGDGVENGKMTERFPATAKVAPSYADRIVVLLYENRVSVQTTSTILTRKLEISLNYTALLAMYMVTKQLYIHKKV